MKRIILASVLTLSAAVAQEHGQTGAAQPGQAAQHGEAAGHGGGEGEHQDNNLGMLKFVNFGILAGILAWVIGKNAGPFFTSRSAEIRKSIDDAKKLKADSEARAAAIEKRIASLSDEVAGIRNTSKKEMEAEAARVKAETARMLERMQESAQQEMASVTKQAQAELKQHAAKLALELAEQKLKSRLDGAAQDTLVSNFLNNMRREASHN